MPVVPGGRTSPMSASFSSKRSLTMATSDRSVQRKGYEVAKVVSSQRPGISHAGDGGISQQPPCSAKPRQTGGFTLTRQRSEEHTSELQSQSNLVCRLLLEKKKK